MYKKHIQQIANILCVNYQHINRAGLLRGHLGVAIFLYHYHRLVNVEEYEDIANSIIDYVYKQSSEKMSIDFADGLTGIGWGLKYLHDKDFVDMEVNSLMDIDKRLRKITLNEYRKERKNEIPLLSKGLYFNTQKDFDEVKTVLSFLEKNVKKLFVEPFQLCYFNSIIYFLLKCIKCKSEVERCCTLLNYLIDSLELSIKENSCGNKDLYIFKTLTSNAGINIQIPDMGFNLLDDIYLNWQTIIYADLLPHLPQLPLEALENYIDERKCDITANELSLTGFAGLGINLIWQEDKQTREVSFKSIIGKH